LSPRIEDLGNKFIKIVPGPGSYTPSEKRKANLSFSFGLKPSVDFHIKYQKSIPGPGSYSSRAIKTFNTVGASLDKSERKKLISKMQEIVPGPGRYQPPPLNVVARNAAPRWGFGTSERPDIGGGLSKATLSADGRSENQSTVSFKSPRPGPGAYEIKGVIGTEGPKRSLAGRYKIDLTIKEINSKPGPG
jgi:hypothetical protein